MEDYIIDNFKSHFPALAKQMVSCEKDKYGQVTAVLKDGRKILYDDFCCRVREVPDSSNLTREEFGKDFGQRLWYIMRCKGVDQVELSKRTRISQPRISDYINGVSVPSFYITDKIARALDCSIDDLRC